MTDNYDRADFAAAALEAYRAATGDDADTGLGDLLTDLRHWADLHGANFDNANRNAEVMYRTELREDGGPCLPAENPLIETRRPKAWIVVELRVVLGYAPWKFQVRVIDRDVLAQSRFFENEADARDYFDRY
jgi:hypothetical protein